MMSRTRRAGLLIPLFSAPSSDSWGIGDIGDIGTLCEWLAASGQRILQLLPLNEMAPGAQSPYSAMSAMAIDPIYIRVPDVEDFRGVGGEASLSDEERAAIVQAQQAPRVAYSAIRPVKDRALRSAFDRFFDREWSHQSSRAAALRAYIESESWWLEDYAVFRALHDREGGASWVDWPDSLSHRDVSALADARASLAREVLFRQYLQWLASDQWSRARADATASGVALFGDLPFMVDLHSADVWANQEQFHVDRSVGVPPDAFSATGQDWGMPAYNWEAIESVEFKWMRDRARRSAALFDGYRVDHLVGFYRTYSRPRTGAEGDAAFSPDGEAAQQRLGETMLAIFQEPGAEIIAEDLGTVPEFVHASLRSLGVPGFKVFRWERDWDEEGQPFRDPANYPAVSVATTGTHDTETLVVWWEAAPEEERAAVAAVPSIQAAAGTTDLLTVPFVPGVRDVLLDALFASGSEILLLPVQDVFGWPDRINEPATVNDLNWTYRLPWPVDQFENRSEAIERRSALRAWAEKNGRI